MSFKNLVLILLFLNSLQAIGQLGGDSWQQVSEEGSGTLLISYSENRPFIYQNENSEWEGIEYELLLDFKEFIASNYQKDLTLEWQYLPTFESLFDTLRYSTQPMLGLASLSITEDRKNQIHLTQAYLPDIEIIVTSNNLESSHNLGEFARMLKNSRALSVPNSTFERNILDLKENYFPNIFIQNVSSVDVLIDSIHSRDNLWGYISLPNYLISYRNNKQVVRQRFFAVENEGLAIGGTSTSDWHVPLNEYFNSSRFSEKLDELISFYLGPTFNKVVWSISAESSDASTNNLANKEVGMLTLEKELQATQLKQNALEIENKNLIISSVVIGVAFLLILLSVLFLFLRHKSQTNRQLNEKNEQIKQQANNIRESYENLKRLSEVGRDISASLSVEHINERIYESLNSFMDVGVFGIGLFNEKNQTLDFSGVIERGKKLNFFQYELSDASRLAVHCFNQNEEIVIQSLQDEFSNYSPALPETKQGDHTESIIYMPLSQGSKRVGVISVQSFNKHAFTDYQVDVVRNIANYSKAALDNASAYELISKQAEVLEQANEEIKKNTEFIERQNEELVSVNREKNDLIGIVAHDLKNPLASALSLTNTFSAEERITEEDHEYLFLIRKNLNRMNELINKILDIKRIEANSLDPQFEEVNLKYILEEAVDDLLVQAENKNIRIEMDLLPAKVSIDPDLSLQVFENLISNAIKFSNSGSKIHIKMSDVNGDSMVEVIDEGPGLTEDDKGKLFRKFQKLSATPTGGEISTGLGLSIVKEYVNKMNGEIRCESEVGKGANFIVSFKKAQ